MSKYVVDYKAIIDLRFFIEHDTPKQAIQAVESEVLVNLPEELGDFVIEHIEIIDRQAEEVSE